MRPADAFTDADRLKLETDNYPPDPDVWSILLHDGYVSLHRPDGGWVEIPQKEFEAIATWYLAEQQQSRKRRKR